MARELVCKASPQFEWVPWQFPEVMNPDLKRGVDCLALCSLVCLNIGPVWTGLRMLPTQGGLDLDLPPPPDRRTSQELRAPRPRTGQARERRRTAEHGALCMLE